MFKILDGRNHFYQWDLDRKLIVEDKTINKVYFCNKLGNCSVVRCVYDVNGMRLVDVPNLILQKAFSMYVYGYDSNYTKYDETFEIKARTKPEDYVYTDEELKVWDELEQRIVALEEAEIDIDVDLSDYYTKAETDALLEVIEPIENGILPYCEERIIYVGENLYNVNNITLGDGWELNGEAITHKSGTTEPLTITFNGVDQENYLLRFNTSYYTGEFATFRIGEGYPELAYSARTDITMPLKCWGTPTLIIEPYLIGSTTVAFTLSNIKLQKIQDSGEQVILRIDSVITENNKDNLGYRNVYLGSRSAQNAIGATRNITIGTDTLRDLRGGHRNIAIGGHSLSMLNGGDENIGIGCDAGIYVKQGKGNIVMGVGALGYAKNATDNIAIGRNALCGNAEGTPNNNVALGARAGYKTASNNNIFIGYMSGYNNTTGYGNVFIGANANGAYTPGNFNTFIGNAAFCAKDGVYYSVAIGYNAKTTKPQQIMIGGDTCKEVVFCGNKKLIFNDDGSVMWEELA